MSDLAFVAPVSIPFVFLAATWLALRGRKIMRRVWLSGLAVLASLPVGLFIVGMIYLPPYDPRYEHNPGVGVAFVPILMG